MDLARRIPIVAALIVAVASSGAAQSGASAPEPDAPVDPRLQFMVSEYQAHWQRLWRDSEEYRRLRVPLEVFRRRHIYLFCYSDLFLDRIADRKQLGKAYGFPEPYYYMITSARPARGWCPTWSLAAPNIDVNDESEWRDGALRPSLRDNIARKRSTLLHVLDSVYSLDPTNAWVAGQLTRFLLDAREYDDALTALARCRAGEWWCAGLTGLAQARAGQLLLADSSFARMRRVMADSVRCAWEDASDLLPSDEQGRYRDLTCAIRDTLNARLWWLADPLYREAGNARLVEQEARRMEIALRRATTQDDRFSFDDERGGDAVVAVLTRYGWPSYRAWSGVAMDRNHSYQGYEINHNAPPSPPYTTLEYSAGRVRTIPDWRAVESPFNAMAENWQLAPYDSSGRPSTAWWPQEHFRPARRLMQLPQGQTVTVRRQSHAEVVVAVELASHAQVPRDAVVDGILLATSGPGQLDSLDQQLSKRGNPIRLRGRIKSDSTILAVEVSAGGADAMDARTRFAIAPPAPLDEMPPNKIALSDVAILSPLTPELLAAPTDSLLQFLLPRLRLSRTERRVAIYWESYGTSPGDSATVALRVVRESDAGLLRRLGIAAGVFSDPARGIEIRWRDHEVRGGATTLVGPVPAQIRAISLDLAGLAPGRYAVDITMFLRDGRSSHQQAFIELTP